MRISLYNIGNCVIIEVKLILILSIRKDEHVVGKLKERLFKKDYSSIFCGMFG